jgi:MFS family permease
MSASRARAFVPGLLLIGLVVSLISSLGAPLIPTIAHDLGASVSSAQWSLTATLLVGAVAAPIVGRLGDGPLRRELIIGCLAAVTVGGALAAVAGSLPLLVAGRALQGMGLALLPLTMAAARDALPRDRAPGVIAALSVITAVGVGLGYPLTGLIADALDTAAAFWFGVLISALALALAVWIVPSTRATPSSGRLDVGGAGLVGVGLVALLVALERGPDWGWGALSTLGLLVVGLASLAAWGVHELRTTDPLVDLRLLRHRPVLTANVSALVIGVAMYLSITLMTQLVQLQAGLGESVFVAGLTLVPMSATSFASSRVLPAVQRRLGARATIPIGAIALGAGVLFFGLTGTALWQAFVTMGLVGVGLGFTFAAMPAMIVGSVPQAETSSAMSFYQVTRYVGFSVGSAVAVTLLRAFGGEAPGPDAYRSTFLVAAVVCAATAALAWMLPGRAPADRGAEDLDAYEVEEGLVASAGLEMLEDGRVRRA